MTIDVALSPAEIARLPEAHLRHTTCVVFDVLRATSTMLTGLAHGVLELIPVSTIEEAHTARVRMPDALLGGERHGDRIEGFDLGNSPFEYRELAGRRVITTTTNGTVALRACVAAKQVLVGAVLNLSALTAYLREAKPEEVMLVCAGTGHSFALEDAWAAGRLIDLLDAPELTDAAEALRALARQYPDPLAPLRAARNGRALLAKQREAEVEWCARESVLEVIGVMEEGHVRRLRPTEEVELTAE